MDWMEIIEPNVNREKLKRPTKHTLESLFRDHPHSTINGKGSIARLRKKGKK